MRFAWNMFFEALGMLMLAVVVPLAALGIAYGAIEAIKVIFVLEVGG